MKSTNYISNYSIIEDNAVFLNGKKIIEQPDLSFSDFAKEAYKKAEISYPKFFKMDKLSKLAFLAAEIIFKEILTKEKGNDIALVFANQSASLDTDVNYQKSIADQDDYFPSPGLFVYTLPNICIGEISIRHQLKTENAFFVSETFDIDFISTYANALMETGKAQKVLCGWIELYEENYKAFVYLVEHAGIYEHNNTTINKLFKL